MYKYRRLAVSLIAVALVAAMLAGFIVMIVNAAKSSSEIQEEIDKLQEQSDELAAQREELESQISANRSKTLTTVEQKAQVDQQIELTRQDIEDAGATVNQTGGLVNRALEIEGVRMAILATEREDGVKLSLRAVEPDTVSDIAKQFGGGGHAQAAGVTMQLPMKDAVSAVLAAMSAKLR